MTSKWMLGDFFCRFESFITQFAAAGSILCLTLLSWERKVGILRRGVAVGSHKAFYRALLLVWVGAACLSSIPAVYSHVQDLNFREVLGSSYFIFENYSLPIVLICKTNAFPTVVMEICDSLNVLILFLLPFAIIVYAHTRIVHLVQQIHQRLDDFDDGSAMRNSTLLARQRRIFRVAVSMVIIFTIAWLPYHIFFIVVNYANLKSVGWLTAAYNAMTCLALSSCAVNPLYIYLSCKQYRQALFKIFSFGNQSYRRSIQHGDTASLQSCLQKNSRRVVNSTRVCSDNHQLLNENQHALSSLPIKLVDTAV